MYHKMNLHKIAKLLSDYIVRNISLKGQMEEIKYNNVLLDILSSAEYFFDKCMSLLLI